jgi:uncharacterized membrane protein (UPF0127 family)
MNKRILNKICIYQQYPEKLLSCCKNFTLERIRNIRWKNRIYFRDNRIKIVNCESCEYLFEKYKEKWLKNGKIHRYEIDPKTGLILPAIICYNGIKCYYKDGFIHRDDIDPDTGLTFHANNTYCTKIWFKYGEFYRYDIDPDTGFTLPYTMCNNCGKRWYKDGDNIDPETGLTLPAEILQGLKMWYKNNNHHRDELDPDTGHILPASIYNNGMKFWYKDGLRHRDEIDPDTGLTLPSVINPDGSKYWHKNGIEFCLNYNCRNCKKSTKLESFFSKRKNRIFLSIGAILPILYFIHKK